MGRRGSSGAGGPGRTASRVVKGGALDSNVARRRVMNKDL